MKQDDDNLNKCLSKYVEIDFAEITSKKSYLISKNDELSKHLGNNVKLGQFVLDLNILFIQL